ncbi:glycosyltransferase family 4 protein [Reichenbachiella carrageenanivorans]|uniref:Glycosyltransferase family 4 protein n=1 Tax=Reichenbachiella carrageenanivorans TaxID=2979869 RepID=A0ABY6D7S4_9BACT|nr:glycosyltransferase family 4 protein [Reichenbachiella carrageenanivorans]UXX81118.1 glycosyltransferase family 4 protein [Reichenbachiella carrageenanivorans]
MSKKILFLTPYPKDTAGSQRFRFEQYLNLLVEHGIYYESQSFIDEATWKVLYKEGYAIQKIWGILLGFIRRVGLLISAHRYDFVFVHREATPLGFPFIEWLIVKVWRKRLIYDFDDAIWMPNTSVENSLISKLKFPEKINKIIGWSYAVSAGNQYLMDHARLFNQRVHYNPTTIDTTYRHKPSVQNNDLVVIGWTGTHSTLKYLELLRQPLVQLALEYDFVFQVIADKEPETPMPNQRFIAWSKSTEIADLNLIDIGVMPLADDLWAKGKCGFKALQFMALEKPVLVSPVGVNAEIVTPDVHGYHCVSADDYYQKLKELISDRRLCKRLGEAGRQKVEAHYSVGSNANNFLELFK